MIDIDRASHLDDGTLVRILDGEEERASQIHGHLDVCTVCRRRMATLRDTGSRLDHLFGGSIASAEPVFEPAFLAAMENVQAAPQRGARRIPGIGLAAAAGMATLLLVASPAGAWIAARIEAAFSPEPSATAAEPAASQASPALAPPAPVGAKVSASVAGTRVVIRLTRGEMPERVAVRHAEGAMATALVRGTAVPAEMLVRPDGFDVMSEGGTLEVEIPAAIEGVEVWIDGRVAARWPDGEATALPWEMLTDR